MEFPINWEVKPDKFAPDVEFWFQNDNTKLQLVTYGQSNTEIGYDKVFSCVEHIIKYNKEKEKKDQLLLEKMRELKKLFEKNDLDTLEKLNFNNLVDE